VLEHFNRSNLSSNIDARSNLAQSDSSISNYVVKKEVQTAEILWALKAVKSHYSYKSSEDINKLFKLMFTDSQVANQFSCGPKKSGIHVLLWYFPSLSKYYCEVC